MAYSYGIPDGTYTGKPVVASCYEKNGRLMLDVRFAVKNPQTGEWYQVNKNGKVYQWEAMKRHWLTTSEGAFNEATIKGLREWAKGWEPRSFEDFWWFQSPDAQGTPFGNLAAIGEVELNFQTDNNGNQNIWAHDPNRPRTGGRTAYVPEGAASDKAALMAKWGAKAKAVFAATPKKVATATPAAQVAQNTAANTPASPVAASAPSADVIDPPAAPTRPAASTPPSGANADWANYPQTCDGAFGYFCSRLGEPYSSAKHDERWFDIFDRAAEGKDPDQFAPADIERLFRCVDAAFVN